METNSLSRKEHLARIQAADRAYYDQDNPIMSDAEYDALRRSYIDKYGVEDLDYVPGSVADGFEKFQHPVAVTSLGKWTKGVDDEADLKAKIDAIWPAVVEPKYDGLTVVAYPNADGSCKFVTRGLGGEIGEVLPNFIPMYEGAGVNNSGYAFRGEVFITPKNFEKLNSLLASAGEEPMKNMRNAAAGLLRRKERSPYLNLLSYIVYEIPGFDGSVEDTENLSFKTKFRFTEYHWKDTTNETVSFIQWWYDSINAEQSYPIDGIVIKYRRDGGLKKFGFTAHHPKNAFAWKALQEEKETVIRDVVWQMGKSKATPVAIVDPVEIDGTTVTRASLHNAEQIKKLGIKIGATVKIRKANQIIPQITEVIKSGDKDIVLDVCPACGFPLTTINGQQFCRNPECEERVAQNIAFLGQKDVLNIPGLSIQTARKLVAHWKNHHPNEKLDQNIVFKTSTFDFENLEGFASASALKIRQAIVNAQTHVELPRFIKALCFDGVGNTVGKILADEFGSLDAMIDAYKAGYDWTRLEGLGPKTAEILSSADFWDVAVAKLRQYATVLPYEKAVAPVGGFSGKVFVLTGKMPQPNKEKNLLMFIANSISKHGQNVLTNLGARNLFSKELRLPILLPIRFS